MIFRNLVNNTCPVILHAPGLKFHEDLLKFFNLLDCRLEQEPVRQQSSLPDTRIVTWNTTSKESPLEKSLTRMGLSYDKLKYEGDWSNYCKFFTLIEFVSQIQESFIIALDSFDVLLIEDLCPLIEWFKQSGLGMLMNGEKRFWPYCKSLDEAYQFQNKLFFHNFPCYLNSGVFIAKRSFLQDEFLPYYFSIKWRDLFTSESDFVCQVEEVYGKGSVELESMKKDDQLFCHIVYRYLYPSMLLDYNNRFFQVIKTWSPESFNLQELGVSLE